jgi:hypothetical protein
MSKDNDIQIELSSEDFEAMIQQKTQENLELQQQLLDLQSKVKSTEIKALAVYEENRIMKASPSVSERKAEMEYNMEMARKFIAGKAFKVETPEQAYVIIQAGAEMGLKPVESMQSLYIVNGAVRYYGDKMIGKITQLGYKITYTDESKDGVTVTIAHPSSPYVYTEKVTSTDDALINSKAFKFAPKNKMRFHGVRMIASFYLPHLFMSVSDEFSNDFHEWDNEVSKDENGNTMIEIKAKEVKDKILESSNIDELTNVWNEHQSEIQRDINLVSLMGSQKKKLKGNGK